VKPRLKTHHSPTNAKDGKELVSQPPQKVTVIVEASDTDYESDHALVIDALDSLMRQTYPRDSVDIIVCQFGWNGAKKRAVLEQFPHIQIFTNSDGGYFRLKNLGIESARGDIIALADADVSYPPEWISQIVHMLELGADVSVGLTKFQATGLPSRLCAFYNFHHIALRIRHRIRRFLSHNVGFKTQIVKPGGYDGRFERSGGDVEFAERLFRNGARIELNPQQRSTHRYDGFFEVTWQGVMRNGYDIFHTRQLHPEMPLATVTRLSIFAPPLLCGIFTSSDMYRLFQNRRLLKIPWHEIPVYLLFIVAVRSLEIVSMYWTLIHSNSIESYVRKLSSADHSA
jgi:glycosyltransferase involved in cell wall biosynthesis